MPVIHLALPKKSVVIVFEIWGNETPMLIVIQPVVEFHRAAETTR